MHVLIPVLHRPDRPTGVCRHGANLARCLAHTHRVERITLVIGDWQVGYFAHAFDLSSPKIQVHVVSLENSSLARNRWFLFGLPKLAQQLQPDLVHLSFPFPILRQRFTMPVVTTLHDLYPYECPENFGYPQVWFNRSFLWQCLHSSDGVACVSRVTQEKLAQYFPGLDIRKPVTVVYNYVDLEPQRFQPPADLGTSPPYWLCVAQHRKNKNLDLLINALGRVRQAGGCAPDTRLILVGSPGPETAALTQLIEQLGLQSSVQMLSALSDEHLGWLYQHCDLFVMPSATEGFCLPLVEALSLSCRVVCSDIPIFREVGSANCVYADLSTAPLDNLTAAIAQALAGQFATAQPQPQPTGTALDSRFTRDQVARQYLAFYNSVSPDQTSVLTYAGER